NNGAQPMSFTLIHGGEIYAPKSLGVQSILLSHDRISKISQIEEKHLKAADLPYEVVDADGCVIIPGLIDPHAHLIGAGGEHGFTSRMPEIALEQLVCAGITTVVGLL